MRVSRHSGSAHAGERAASARMLFAERGGSPALGDFSIGGQNELGSGRERSQVPELLDLVFAGRPADMIGDEKNVGLLKLDAAAVRETRVAAFGFQNVAI